MENEEITAKSTFRKLKDTVHLTKAVHHRKMAEGGPMADAQHGRGRILALLKLKDGIATKDMAEILGIRVSSLNETLGKLEKDGYIERVPSEEDKRIMLVKLTEKGIAEKQPSDCLAEKALADFSEDELATLNGYLDRIAGNIASELGEDGPEMLERMREARKAFFEDGCKGHGPHPHGGPHGHCGPHGGPHENGPEHHGPHGDGKCCHGRGHGHGPGHRGPHGHGPGHHGPHAYCDFPGHGGPHCHRGPHGHGGPHGHCGPHGHRGPHGHGCCHA